MFNNSFNFNILKSQFLDFLTFITDLPNIIFQTAQNCLIFVIEFIRQSRENQALKIRVTKELVISWNWYAFNPKKLAQDLFKIEWHV